MKETQHDVVPVRIYFSSNSVKSPKQEMPNSKAQEDASETLCYPCVPAIPNPSHHFSHEQSHSLQLGFSQTLVQKWHLRVAIKAQPRVR